jgi:hypothetical protein
VYTGGILMIALLATNAKAIFNYTKARERPPGASRAALFIVLYPPVLIYIIQNTYARADARISSLDLSLGIFSILTGLAWISAGIYLNGLLKDRSKWQNQGWLGFPVKGWALNAIFSIVAGYFWGK